MSGKKNHPAKKPKLEIVTKREATDYTDKTEGECKSDIKKHEERVRAQEIEQLREFTVLDEVKSDDEDDSNDDNSETSSIGLPDEELDKMLDENLPDDFKSPPKQKDETFVTRTKLVLEEKGVDQFENLPLDWMMLRHYSGMPIYMHRITQVCTLSKPYNIGKGNTRKHDIPISAIPCLLYRRALEEEQKQEIIDNRLQEQIQIKLDERKRSGEGTSGVKTEKKETANVGSKDDLKKKNDIEKCPFLVPKKEPSVEEPKDDKHLTPQQVNEYCKRLFKFKKVNIVHFKSWADRRKYCEARKTLQYPTLPAPHFYK